MKKFAFDKSKFKNLVHYIIWSCPDAAKLGSVKLHKILWKSDTASYVQRGEPITGARYVKGKFGPTANALLSIRKELKAEGKIDFWTDTGFSSRGGKHVYVSRRKPDLSTLPKDERDIVDHWLKEICLNHTAESISEETHGYAWEIAAMGEELPLYSVLVERGREPNEKELEWARGAARRRGLIK